MKNNPYIGPRPFERRDRHNFHGREREARELRALIVAEREVLFYAQSGAGKTSLLNARVIPALEAKRFHVLPVVRVGNELPPGVQAGAVDNVFVFSALLALAGEKADPQALLEHTLPSYLEGRRPQPEAGRRPRPLVLILDQFEEIFTTHRERWQEIEGFFVQVREALEALPRLGVVFAMREDHVAAMDPFIPLFPRRLRARFRMERLGLKGALTAVKRPAESAGCPFDSGVAEQLVDDLRRIKVQRYSGSGDETTVEGPYVEPVQLQVVCRQLWDNLPEQEDSAIQWAEVEQYGNIDRALTDFYESALNLAKVSEPSQGWAVSERQLRRWFGEGLITPVGTRGLVLRGPEETAGLPNAAVDVLEARHIIRADVRAGARWYELSHDRLVEPILDSNRAWEAARETPLKTAARRWKETGDAALLYQKAVMEEALAWVEANRDQVEPYEKEFLEASQEAEQERRRQRRRYRVGAIVGLLVLIVVAVSALVAFQLWGIAKTEADRAEAAKITAQAAQAEADRHRDIAVTEANKAESAQVKAERLTQLALSRQLAAQSINQLNEVSWEPAFLLAIQAGYTADTAEAFAALRQTFAHPGRILFILSGHTRDVVQAEWNVDESRILTASGDGTARVWDAETGAELFILSGGRTSKWRVDRIAKWNADGSRILTDSDDNTAKVWDAGTGAELFTLSGHTDAVIQAEWNADESRILTASDDNTARVWDAETGDELFTLSGYTPKWNTDESRILTASEDGTVRVWDVSALRQAQDDAALNTGAETGAELFTLSGYAPRWNTDESRILTISSDDTTARVWDVSALRQAQDDAALNSGLSQDKGTGALTTTALFTLSGHTDAIEQAEWNADGSRILTASLFDNTARVWDAETGNELLTFSSSGRAAKWNAAGSRILAVSNTDYDNAARVWDAKTGDELFTLSGHTGFVMQAEWSADESRILTVSDDYTASVWDAETGAKLFTLSGHTSRIYQAQWNADGSRIMTVSSDDTARVWNVEMGGELSTLSGGTDAVEQAEWNADGSRILTPSNYHVARVWDVVTGGELLTLSGLTGRVRQAVWNADESRILIVSSDFTAQVWDAGTGAELFTLSADLGLTSAVLQAVWNTDGSRILTAGCVQYTSSVGCKGMAWLWDAETGNKLLTFSGHTGSVKQAEWNADESRILTASLDGSARVWDAETGTELFTLPGHTDTVVQAEWNADESRILTASNNGTARVWDAETGTELFTLSGHTAKWNADGSRILTASDDNMARVWDAETGAELFTFSGHTAEWNADGSRILTASDDNTARVWDVSALRQAQNDAVLNPGLSQDKGTGALTTTALFTLSGHMDDVTQAEWNADESRILTASDDNTARVWDVSALRQAQDDAALNPGLSQDKGTGALTTTALFTLSGHAGAVVQAEWNADESRILTQSYDDTVRVWDAETGAELFTIPSYTAEWNADKSRILTQDTAMAKVWDVETETELFALFGHTGDVTHAEWNADESRILTASDDNTARVWDAETGDELSTLSGHTGDVVQAQWNTDGNRILTASDDKTARVWDVSALRQAQDDAALNPGLSQDEGTSALMATSLFTLSDHTDAVIQAEWNADESRILTASDDNTARVWDAETGAALFTLFGHTAEWNADESRILTASDDNTARVWDVSALRQAQDDAALNTGALTTTALFTLSGHTSRVNQAEWNADESRILTASDDNTARVWDAETGAPVFVLSGHIDAVMQAEWNADGSRILTVSYDNTARVWDAETGAELFTLSGHTSRISQAEWNADGSHILTAGCDRFLPPSRCVESTTRVWDVSALRQAQDDAALNTGAETGTELFILSVYTGRISQAEWNADESRILTGISDGTVRLWYARMDELLDEACRQAPRNMTRQEWDRYFPGQEYRKTCADLPVHPSVIESFIEQGESLARDGQLEEALAAYAEAQTFDPELEISANSWNTLCRYGSLWGHATAVIDACERAVELEPEFGLIRDSRGLTRALTGDYEEAIKDFEFFIAWTPGSGYEYLISERKAWIVELQAGRNPFDEETLEALRNE